VELLVPLTWPLDIEDEKITVNHHRHLPYLRLAQVEYKRAIIHYDIAEILRTAIRVALPSIATLRSERSPRDDGIIRLALYFIRNVTMITQPPDLPSDGDEAEISRSAVVDAFHSQDIFAVLLTLSSSMGEEFVLQDVVILEILFFILKGVDPVKLFMEDEQASTVQNDNLKAMMQKEKALLSDYKRHAPSRHNRFGTMVWLKRDNDKVSTVTGQVALHPEKSLQEMDKSKQWNKPKFHGKRSKEEDKQSTEFDKAIPLTDSARKHLRQFVEDFLDSSFNPLFAHLRKGIEREAERVLETHPMQFWYLVSWFLQAECARRRRAKQKREERARAGEEALAKYDEESYGLIACVMNQESFILLNRYMHRWMDDKDWQELNAGMKCFTQILHTVQEMSDSPFEDDQEIAENIQNRIFYEESTHDRIVSILRNYKDQDFGYLDACTELAHTFIRMLELYSKQNIDMQVRSRRRARKKRKAIDDNPSADADDGAEAEDVREAERITRERRFDFSRFTARFVNQGCVNTFLAFTKFYNDLSNEQLKRAHRFFYRVAFKNELSTVLFRLDIIQLFHKMIKGPEGLNRELPIYKDWEEFSRQLFRRLTKRLPDRPSLAIELLFSKIPATTYYLEHGHEKEVPTKTGRPAAELELRAGVEKEQGMGALVALLHLADQDDITKWLGGTLEEAAKERQAWEDQHFSKQSNGSLASAAGENSDAENGTGESAKAPSIRKFHSLSVILTIANKQVVVKPKDEKVKKAMFKNGRLRLLMKLLGFELLGLEDDPNASWIIPSNVTSAQLHLDKDTLERAIADPPVAMDEEGRAPEDFIRRKPLTTAEDPTQPRIAGAFDDDSDSMDDFLDFDLFPAGGPTARKSDALEQLKKSRRKRNRVADDLDDEEKGRRAEARKLADLERQKKIKSELLVHESDDETDEERDKSFFELEAERRKKTSELFSKAMSSLTDLPTKTKKKRKSTDVEDSETSKRRRTTTVDEDSDSVDDIVEISSESSSSDTDSDEDMDDMHGQVEKETPLSSEQVVLQESDEDRVLQTTSANKVATIERVEDKGMDSEDELPVQRPVRSRMRAGFVIESDSE